MPEMTRVERARLDELKGKTPHPSASETPANMRGEGEEIEFRRLTERLEAEERLEALRAQPERSQEDLAEMRTLGAPDDEIMNEERARVVAETKARAKDAPADERAAVRDTRPMQDKERAGAGQERADAINREREMESFEERGRTEDEAKAAPDVAAKMKDAQAEEEAKATRAAGGSQADADRAANLPSQQRAASERLGREADAVQERERAERGEKPKSGMAAQAAQRTPEQKKVHDARVATLRAMPKRTPEQDEELRGLECLDQ